MIKNFVIICITSFNAPAFGNVGHPPGVGNGDAPANSYVVFNNVNHNNGSHYNASDGKFTAPVTGVYYFSVWHYTGSTSAISFRINGSQYGAYSWDGQGGFPSWVCPMTAGDYAQIFTVNPYGFRGTADYHNAFNGFLIG